MIRKASEEKFSYVILQKQLKKSPEDDRHPHFLQNDWTLDPEDVDPGIALFVVFMYCYVLM